MRIKPVQHQSGIVALITVIFSSILFSVVIIAMVGIVSTEQRQASQADLTNRAYFAAEGGVEEGLLQLKNAIANCSSYASCPAFNGSTDIEGHCLTQSAATTGPSGASYTCVILNHESNDATDTLTPDGDAYQLDLSSIQNISKIVIKWHIPGSQLAASTTTDGTNYTLPATGNSFSNVNSWGYPAVLEVQSILFNANAATYNPNTDLKLFEDVLSPTSTGGTITEDDDASAASNANASANAYCQLASAIPSDGYACSETINISNSQGGNYSRILRLRSRYAQAHVDVEVFTGVGGVTQAQIPDSFETLDVTAKSGNTYRRVRAKVLIQQNTVALDYALYSDTDICHDFEIRSSKSTAGGTGGNTTTNVGLCPF